MTSAIFRTSGSGHQVKPERQGLLELRSRLLVLGYSPVPVCGKNPSPIQGWNAGIITPERIERDVLHWPTHKNTGLLTTHLPTFDIDVRNDDHTAEIGIVIADQLGLTPLLRYGSKGLAMCYRLDGEPIGKIVVKHDTGKRTKDGKPLYDVIAEILGRGNQMVAYGIHSDTHNPYAWVGDSEPLAISYPDLPSVTPDQLRKVAENIRFECKRLGYTVERVGVEGSEKSSQCDPGRFSDADTVTQKFIDLLPRGRPSPTGYHNFNCPACSDRKQKGGFLTLANGGFLYKCFRASCEFNKATGWQPGRNVGEREKQLYSLLGGDPKDLSRRNTLMGYASLSEYLAEFKK